MKTERNIAHFTALLTRALETKDYDNVKQYVYGLTLARAERIKELEKEIARRDLLARYKKDAA